MISNFSYTISWEEFQIRYFLFSVSSKWIRITVHTYVFPHVQRTLICRFSKESTNKQNLQNVSSLDPPTQIWGSSEGTNRTQSQNVIPPTVFITELIQKTSYLTMRLKKYNRNMYRLQFLCDRMVRFPNVVDWQCQGKWSGVRDSEMNPTDLCITVDVVSRTKTVQIPTTFIEFYLRVRKGSRF